MKEALERLSAETQKMSEIIDKILKAGLDKDIVLDEFKKQKQRHYNKLLDNSVKEMSKIGSEFGSKAKEYHEYVRLQELVHMLVTSKKKYNEKDLLEILKELKQTLPKAKVGGLEYEIVGVPVSIRSEVMADVDEAKRCFETGCYRSCTILCGRILEICLHRKHYDLTKKDILETSPGLGLGKLIAKLRELNVGFDPGLTEQIHLINKIRISSVHKKQKTFSPSKSQAQAMFLYTVDVVNKLF